MSQSLSQLWVHIIFSTKKRYPFLMDITVRQRLYEYINGICHHLDCNVIAINGIEDHVHLLISLHKRYVMNQYEHHKKQSFQDEFRKFLICYDVAYKEEYVWD